MQQKSEKYSEFSDRTKVLASNLGVNISDLPDKIGVSPSMFHAYRSGKYPISKKAWSKLEQAEEAYARTHLAATQEIIRRLKDSGENAQSSTDPKQADVRKSTHHALEESPMRRSAERMVPLIGWAHAGEAGSYEEIPESWQNRVPTDCPDPKAFGVSLEGDSMEPKFSDGDILIVQPATEAHSGCYVVARFIDDSVIFRRLEMRRGKIILVPLNPQYMASEHTAEEFSWIYPVWGRWTQIWRK